MILFPFDSSLKSIELRYLGEETLLHAVKKYCRFCLQGNSIRRKSVNERGRFCLPLLTMLMQILKIPSCEEEGSILFTAVYRHMRRPVFRLSKRSERELMFTAKL